MATVVVVLSGTCDRSSTSVLATVITASVVRGVISDTEPTNVVFPTPKPPATTILTDVIAAPTAGPWLRPPAGPWPTPPAAGTWPTPLPAHGAGLAEAPELELS